MSHGKSITTAMTVRQV